MIKNGIGLGCIEGDLCSEGDPRDEAEDQSEKAIEGTRSFEVMPDHIAPQSLEDRPGNASDNHPRDQRTGGDLFGGERPKGGEVEPNVDDCRQNVSERAEPDIVLPKGAESGEGGRHDQTDRQHDEKDHRAGHSGHVVRSHRAGDVPDLLHRIQPGLGQAARAIYEPEDSEDETEDGRAFEGVDVMAELLADNRELAQGGVKHSRTIRRVVRQDDAQDGHQEEEQREDGDEHGIGELNAKSASVVVTVFLYDREDEARYQMTLLKLVDTPDCSLNRVHGGSPSWSGRAQLCRTLGTHFQRIYEKKSPPSPLPRGGSGGDRLAGRAPVGGTATDAAGLQPIPATWTMRVRL
jgi:hypothetical protein